MRFENLNLLRAIAALAVVAYHVIEHAGRPSRIRGRWWPCAWAGSAWTSSS